MEHALAPLRRRLSTPRPEARSGSQRATPAAERRTVTVMFADISGFTALSERVDAEQVRSLLNTCFDQLVPAVERYGGTIDKFAEWDERPILTRRLGEQREGVGGCQQ